MISYLDKKNILNKVSSFIIMRLRFILVGIFALWYHFFHFSIFHRFFVPVVIEFGNSLWYFGDTRGLLYIHRYIGKYTVQSVERQIGLWTHKSPRFPLLSKMFCNNQINFVWKKNTVTMCHLQECSKIVKTLRQAFIKSH
mgnify:CR=1 FL=1